MTGQEQHGMLIRPDETIKSAEFDEPTAAPVASSPLIDAAVLLPNVNDEFEDHDIGPYGVGKTRPHYGPRPRPGSASDQSVDHEP